MKQGSCQTVSMYGHSKTRQIRKEYSRSIRTEIESRRHNNKLVATIVVLLTLVVTTSPTQEQIASDQRGGSLARSAMIYHFRKTKDPGLLAEQVFSANLYRTGLSAHEIVIQTLEKRREWARLRRAASTGEWHTSEKGKAVVRALGRTASHLMNAGSVGVEAANMAIELYEDTMRGTAVRRGAIRLAESYHDWDERLKEPEETVFDTIVSLYRENENFRSTWDVLFLAEYGFRPDAADHTVTYNSPEFAMHENVRTILRASQEARDSNDASALLREIQAIHREVHERIDASSRSTVKIHADIRSATAALHADLRERWVLEDIIATRRQQTMVEDLEMAAYHTAVDLATTFVGFRDPKLARQIGSVNHAIFGIRDGLRKYHHALNIGASTTLASLALAGNFVGATLGLVDIFMDTGPSTDEIILDEVRRIAAQVENVRQEMHERFHSVHEHLDEIYGIISHGLKVLIDYRHEDARSLERLALDLQQARHQLSENTEVQLDTQAILVRQGELLQDLIVNLRLAPCLRDHDPDVGDPMDLAKFRDCRSAIETLAVQLPKLQIGDDLRSLPATALWLDARPDGTIARSYREFKRLHRSADTVLPDSIVGPDAWFYVVDIHDRFLSKYPILYKKDLNEISNSEFARTMRSHRVHLRRFMRVINDALAAFQAGSSDSVFQRLIDEAGYRGLDRLFPLLRDIHNDFYLDRRHFVSGETYFYSAPSIDDRSESASESSDRLGLLLPEGLRFDVLGDGSKIVGYGGGMVLPEVFFELGPYDGWVPMGYFYEDVPDWVTVQGEYCPDEIPENAVEALRRAFSNIGILNYVHPNDLMLARVGLGKFEVCGSITLNERRWEETKRQPPVHYPVEFLETSLGFGVSISFNGTDDSCGSRIVRTGGVGRKRILRRGKFERGNQQTFRWDPSVHEFVSMINEISMVRIARLVYPWNFANSEVPRPELNPDWDRKRVLLSVPLPVDFRRHAVDTLGGTFGEWSEGADCRQAYLHRFAERKYEYWRFMRDRLLASEEFQRIDTAMMVANYHLRSWITLAFFDATGYSELVSTAGSGVLAFPELSKMIDTPYGSGPQWLLNEVEERIGDLEEALRSATMRAVVERGHAHSILTGTRFDNIDGDYRG